MKRGGAVISSRSSAHVRQPAERRPRFWIVFGLAFAGACTFGHVGASGSERGKGASAKRASVMPPAGAQSIAPIRADDCKRTDRPFEEPLAVVEDLGLERDPPILGFPIAFPKNADLRSLNGFYAKTLDGVPLPTQLEVLSRWGGGPSACDAPIRWAYGFAKARVPPKERAYLVLAHEPGADHSVGPALSIDEDERRVVIDTGPARFTVRKDMFNALSLVELATPSGLKTVVDLEDNPDTGMIAVQDRDHFSALHGGLSRFEVERRGPVTATILARGAYAKKGGAKLFRFTVRMHFFAGSSAVGFDHTYYNGEVTDETAKGGKKRIESARVFLRIPLAAGGPKSAIVRGAERVHRLDDVTRRVSIAQHKRSPDRPEVAFSIESGEETIEAGTFGERPMLAVLGRGTYAMATIGFLGPRDPQALRFDPTWGALEIDWQSEPMFIGGARGIWSKAVLDFGTLGARESGSRAETEALARRGLELYAQAARPLIALPSTAYLDSTSAHHRLPAGDLPAEFRRFDEDVDRIHDRTAAYLRKYRITGTQIWPDLPRSACHGAECAALEKGYFEGGDDNYWDWSLVELEEFLRTADPGFIHDFALPQAITMAETVSFRPDAAGARISSFAGFSPCYGGGRGEDGVWREGLNHRTGTCPGDYSYNKVERIAYLLTADRRFTDFFHDGAETAIRLYGDPDRRNGPPETWLELSASRTTYQYLEPLLDAAELTRGGDRENGRYRDIAIRYFEHMRKTSLERGHVCNLLGSGQDDPKATRGCTSDQAWMLPVWIDWVARLYRLYDHQPAKAWLLDFAKTSARMNTVLDQRGLPDISKIQASSSDNAENGWRTVYHCSATSSGIDDRTCQKDTSIENKAYFYPNGLVAYLNAFGLVLETVPEDPIHICLWLPDAFAEALRGMRQQNNGWVWGKELGQAHAMTQATLGAIETCKKKP